MTTLSTAQPDLRSALEACRSALRRVAMDTMPPALDQRLRDLGERKEFLSPEEHAELLALVAFTQQRTLEKLEAELALRRLQAVVPDPAAS